MNKRKNNRHLHTGAGGDILDQGIAPAQQLLCLFYLLSVYPVMQGITGIFFDFAAQHGHRHSRHACQPLIPRSARTPHVEQRQQIGLQVIFPLCGPPLGPASPIE
ncbi:hypothetical protein ABU162_15040 [Paenibacillus thiaminolyticus]|uniref:hypothetical protein n=1 Tax=Paenibacillus thiaminolyticus TaxID=49283 RepID=UPI0035A71FB1